MHSNLGPRLNAFPNRTAGFAVFNGCSILFYRGPDHGLHSLTFAIRRKKKEVQTRLIELICLRLLLRLFFAMNNNFATQTLL